MEAMPWSLSEPAWFINTSPPAKSHDSVTERQVEHLYEWTSLTSESRWANIFENWNERKYQQMTTSQDPTNREDPSPTQPNPPDCEYDTNLQRIRRELLNVLGITKAPTTSPSDTSPTVNYRRPDSPDLTWDPTIWAPHDPDSFHPPGLGGVRMDKRHRGHMVLLSMRNSKDIPMTITQTSEDVACVEDYTDIEWLPLVPRSSFPWWLRRYTDFV